MRTVDSTAIAPFCEAKAPQVAPKVKEIHSRIKTCLNKAFEWLRQNRHTILAASGLGLAITSTVAGQALTFLPLALIMIAFGTRGMLDQYLAKKALKQGEENLATMQKNLSVLKEKLPNAEQPLNTIEEIDAFADGIVAAADTFHHGLKEKNAFDAGHFKRSLENYTIDLKCYKDSLKKMKADPNRADDVNVIIPIYRNFAQQLHAHIQHNAADSVKRETHIVDLLRKRAARA